MRNSFEKFFLFKGIGNYLNFLRELENDKRIFIENNDKNDFNLQLQYIENLIDHIKYFVNYICSLYYFRNKDINKKYPILKKYDWRKNQQSYSYTKPYARTDLLIDCEMFLYEKMRDYRKNIKIIDQAPEFENPDFLKNIELYKVYNFFPDV